MEYGRTFKMSFRVMPHERSTTYALSPKECDASQHHLVPKVTKERNSMTAKTRFIHKFYKVHYFSQLPDIPVATQFERMRVPKIEQVVDLLI